MKKFFKFAGLGCLGFIAFLFIGGLVVGASTGFESDKKLNVTDSIAIVKEQQKIDSLKLIKDNLRKKSLSKLKSFRAKKDEFNDLTFYTHKKAPRYTSTNFIYPYIGKKGDYFYLRLQLQYASNDWLFINKAIFLVDGKKYELTGTWDRDNNTRIWEWNDIAVDDDILFMLKDISNSKKTKVRYVGSQYHKDRVLTSKEKMIIKQTIDIYQDLK